MCCGEVVLTCSERRGEVASLHPAREPAAEDAREGAGSRPQLLVPGGRRSLRRR